MDKTTAKQKVLDFLREHRTSDIAELHEVIEKQAKDPSLSREGMNAVRFPINYYFRAALISYIIEAIHQ